MRDRPWRRGAVRRVRVSYRAMQHAQEPRPRAKSPFAAAFLSLIFPGLGHAYAGAYRRGPRLRRAAVLARRARRRVALRMDRIELLGCVLSPGSCSAVFVAQPRRSSIYRLVAIVDAYRVAEYARTPSRRAAAAGSAGRGCRCNPLSLAGLLAVVLVMAGGHVVVARYDLLALDALTAAASS